MCCDEHDLCRLEEEVSGGKEICSEKFNQDGRCDVSVDKFG